VIFSRFSGLCAYRISSRHWVFAYGQTVSDPRREIGFSFDGLRSLRDFTLLPEFVKGHARIDITALVGQFVDAPVE
jgi:hypothetical protein